MERYMQMALEEAARGVEAGEGGPFGAVIVLDGEVIATGHNEVVGTNDPTAHAEIVAIRRACARLGSFRLDGCTLYATGEPCPMCFSAIHWARIERVVYCNTKEQAARIGFDDLWITEIIRGERQDPIRFEHRPDLACEALFQRWYDNPDRILY